MPKAEELVAFLVKSHWAYGRLSPSATTTHTYKDVDPAHSFVDRHTLGPRRLVLGAERPRAVQGADVLVVAALLASGGTRDGAGVAVGRDAARTLDGGVAVRPHQGVEHGARLCCRHDLMGWCLKLG